MNKLKSLDIRVVQSQSGSFILFLSDDIKVFDSLESLNDFLCSLTKQTFE